MNKAPAAGRRGIPPLGSDLSCAPIFIVGCGRSGTTLLRLIINRHPDLAIFGESSAFFRDRKYAFLSNHRAFERFIRDWKNLSAQELPYPQLMESDSLKTALSQADTYVAAVTLVMAEFARAERKPVWGEKTPSHVSKLEKIFAAYPKAKVINITRDPRAVVSSAIKQLGDGRFDPVGIYGVARYWVRCQRAIERYLAKFPTNIAMVRYEDLVSQSETVVRGLCEFLGVHYDAGMLDITSTAQRYAPKLNGEIQTHHRGLLENINAEAADRWREALSPDMIALVESATAPWFGRRGYTTVAAESASKQKVGIGLIVRARQIAKEAWAIWYGFALRSFWCVRAYVCG